ncbi:MOSC domain-containing protein [Metapseudomonas lalkuanensis]|uniref:MOSC domain-containing protein n=1 Tax=Metapseudomonas lalkuanensis TaxID=2604832 RepID=A0A5J6QIX3_9GAMM|nr:MOSC domain-containing protein [Pseudomonas lalkuanensis]QEY62343.1 MOSC domain-containing protein [Pseudomonas lalkuanensis]UCP00207.1 MOSC domain-containing protein [Pseudomonas lalkuanensis]
MLRLSSLYRFPMKSAIGEPLQQARLDGLGLAGDRRWMLVDADNGRFLTQRAFSQMSQLSARWNDAGGLTLSAAGLPTLEVPLPDPDTHLRGTFVWGAPMHVPDAGDEAAEWLSGFLGKACRLVHVPDHRARDIPGSLLPEEKVGFADGYPLLLIGQASLDDLSKRVGRPLEMLRFRPNLVVEGSEAYAEDGWKRIRIGGIEFSVAKGCSRCILTTIDPATGERNADREPLTTLKTYREREGEVYFGQNLINRSAGVLEVGMEVEVLE